MSPAKRGARARKEYTSHEYSNRSNSTNLANGNVKTYLDCVFIPSVEQGFISAPQEEFNGQGYLLKPGTEHNLSTMLRKFHRKLRWRRMINSLSRKRLAVSGITVFVLILLILGPISTYAPFGEAIVNFVSFPLVFGFAAFAFLLRSRRKYDFGEARLRAKFEGALIDNDALKGVDHFSRYGSGELYELGTPSHESLYEALRQHHELGEIALTRESIPAKLDELRNKFPSDRLAFEIAETTREYDELLLEIRDREKKIENLLKSKG